MKIPLHHTVKQARPGGKKNRVITLSVELSFGSLFIIIIIIALSAITAIAAAVTGWW